MRVGLRGDEAESFETAAPGTRRISTASVEDFATPLEPVEELPEPDDVGNSSSADNFETPLVRNPPSQRLPLLSSPHWAATRPGRFRCSQGYWNAGIPVSDLLTGRVSVQAPAPQPRPSLPPLRLKYTA